ncbi:hypothetical protein [Actinoallomurus rhizosphaericola]|uniref:hypothetical protein n=1 Tax=Actinoallomurus rhizosphaericola TaxID=2952536 RepID=UPI002092C8C5|nr:hypothetical protein [Actinoallomurus rhizosphaericola]MCO5996068.1 hypothetical protein [Actinoallomurus rhizosphaericola]
MITGFVAEARRLTAEPLERLRRGRLPLAFGSAAAVFLLWSLHFSALGASIVRLISDVSASTPFYLAVLRLPASMYAPAPNLPVWGSLLQVFVVFGVAETYVGRRRTLTVALTATFLCTLSGRIMCYLGPGSIVGLPWISRYVSDTGPSAAVVALVAYLCCVRRAPRTLTILLTSMVTEVTLLPNLAGREHVVAIALGLIAALAVPAADRLRVTGVRSPGSGIVTRDHAGLR